MPVLILFATTEGQTRKIAERAGDHLKLRSSGVVVLPIGNVADCDIGSFGRVILMASVHAGRFQPEFISFAKENKDILHAARTAFLSVSLSAASTDAEDLEGIAACVETMKAETGWTPGTVLHVAGAFRFTQYDFLKSWAMRWIAARKDPDASTSGDTEYTDWDALYRFLDAWTGDGEWTEAGESTGTA